MTMGERIKDRRKELKLSADTLAEKLGKNRATIYRYESDEIEDISINTISDIAKALKIDPLYILGWKDDQENNRVQSTYNYFPTAISAGLPFNVEGISDAEKISLPDSLMGRWADNEDVFITRVSGDSMNNIICDGSIIGVLPVTLDQLNNNDIVVFSDGHDYSVKHYHKMNDKIVFRPNSSNAEHLEQHFTTDDEITIHGKVIMWTVVTD